MSTQAASVAPRLATAVQVVDAPTQTNGVSGCGAVELMTEATAAVVDAATETASVDVVHSS